MSICSNASSIVSYNGQEMEVEKAIDDLFPKIQTFINDCHCSIRELSYCEDRNETYLDALQMHLDICSNIDGMIKLFKELKSVSKQLVGPPPKDMKDEVKAFIEQYKNNN